MQEWENMCFVEYKVETIDLLKSFLPFVSSIHIYDVDFYQKSEMNMMRMHRHE